MSAPADGAMTAAEKIALAVIAGALILGTLAYGVFRLYAF